MLLVISGVSTQHKDSSQILTMHSTIYLECQARYHQHLLDSYPTDKWKKLEILLLYLLFHGSITNRQKVDSKEKCCPYDHIVPWTEPFKKEHSVVETVAKRKSESEMHPMTCLATNRTFCYFIIFFKLYLVWWRRLALSQNLCQSPLCFLKIYDQSPGSAVASYMTTCALVSSSVTGNNELRCLMELLCRLTDLHPKSLELAHFILKNPKKTLRCKEEKETETRSPCCRGWAPWWPKPQAPFTRTDGATSPKPTFSDITLVA